MKSFFREKVAKCEQYPVTAPLLDEDVFVPTDTRTRFGFDFAEQCQSLFFVSNRPYVVYTVFWTNGRTYYPDEKLIVKV